MYLSKTSAYTSNIHLPVHSIHQSSPTLSKNGDGIKDNNPSAPVKPWGNVGTIINAML